MSVQPLHDDGDRNPRTMEEARTFVKYVESLFMPWNIDALVDGFTDDCVVRFGTVPESAMLIASASSPPLIKASCSTIV